MIVNIVVRKGKSMEEVLERILYICSLFPLKNVFVLFCLQNWGLNSRPQFARQVPLEPHHSISSQTFKGSFNEFKGMDPIQICLSTSFLDYSC
jgi:hypothetical protein